jgi:UrcA family protein
MTASKMCASTSLAAGIALVLTLGMSGAASARDVTVRASPSEGILSERVSYADLDLASPVGARLLGLRVDGAVGRVCSPLDQRSTFAEHGACKSFARNGARPQMDLAIQRAQQIAQNGVSAIAPVAILIAVPQR